MATQNKLTEKAQEAIVVAQEQAESRNNTQLEPEHLFLAHAAGRAGADHRRFQVVPVRQVIAVGR